MHRLWLHRIARLLGRLRVGLDRPAALLDLQPGLVGVTTTRDLVVPAETEIVLVAGVPALWHLPVSGDEGVGRRTLCGLAGDLYVHGPLMRERRCCAVCAERAPRATFMDAKPSARPRRRAARRVPQLTDAQFEVVRRLYVDEGLGTPAIAELVWQRLGFASASSCGNLIERTFRERGVPLRSRAESHSARTATAKRLVGFGGRKPGEQRLTGPVIDQLYESYKTGLSVPQIAELHAAEYGYADLLRFRSALEYGWKVSGYKLRSNREAELVARARERRYCAATVSLANSRQREERRCTQRPIDGSRYCLAHDPARAAQRDAIVAKLHAGRPRAEVEWSLIRPLLEPLLEARPDRFGRMLEKPSGALARNTGIPGGTCSRLLLGRKPAITRRLAERLLQPLGLTVDDLHDGGDVSELRRPVDRSELADRRAA